MTKCPYCDSTVSPDNPALILDTLNRKIDWDMMESDTLYGYPIGETFQVPDVGQVEVIAKNIESPALNSYGELSQGEEFRVWAVVKANGVFFKKTGTGDSYGSITWNGPLNVVVPKEETVIKYVFG